MSSVPWHHGATPPDPLPAVEGGLLQHVDLYMGPMAGLCDAVVAMRKAGRSSPRILSLYPGIALAQFAPPPPGTAWTAASAWHGTNTIPYVVCASHGDSSPCPHSRCTHRCTSPHWYRHGIPS